MFRKVAIAAVVALLLALTGVLGLLRVSPLSVTVGANPIALVQSGSIVKTTVPALGGSAPMTLPVASTAGTTLIAFVGMANNGGALTISAFTTGWTQVRLAFEGLGPTALSAWYYPNNPGGILTASATIPAATLDSIWWGTVSEWSGVKAVSALDTSGTKTDNFGTNTTLAPLTDAAIAYPGELAISAWLQWATVTGTVTFTTPPGFTRLIDDGSTSANAHLDIEYATNPAIGAPLGPTLTSTGTSNSAVGIIVALRAGTPAVDQTAYLSY